MRVLLISAGIKNVNFPNALLDLPGKPMATSRALCIPTATHAVPDGVNHAWRIISDRQSDRHQRGRRFRACRLQWALEALCPSDREAWRVARHVWLQ